MVLRWKVWKNYDVIKAKNKTAVHWMHLFIWCEKKKNWAKNHQWRLLHKFPSFCKIQDLKAASNVLVTFVNEAPDTHCYVVIFLNRKIHCLIYSANSLENSYEKDIVNNIKDLVFYIKQQLSGLILTNQKTHIFSLLNIFTKN